MQSNNLVVISAAGSRKTSYIVEEALKNNSRKVLILTYTIENLNQIRQYIIQQNGTLPSNLTVQSWYSFLLQECVRPYQSFMYNKRRIENIFFTEGKSAKFLGKSDIEHYYLYDSRKIYTDKISEFVCLCEEKSKGLVIERLSSIYDHIFIDEVQDLAGYDFDLLELFLQSKILITAVGDTRQATYFTNCSPKNNKFKGQNILSLFKVWEAAGMCRIEERNECYRCNQIICDFADILYPTMTKTVSKNAVTTDHDGLFTIKKKDVKLYIEKYNPKVLRYRKSEETMNMEALNFGLSKGQNFDRVIIFATEGIRKFLKEGRVEDIGDIPKFYVALTRARYSIVFVYDEVVNCHRLTPILF